MLQESQTNLANFTMSDLLRQCNLHTRFTKVFQDQGITIERFDKLAKLNQTGFASMIMEKCEMTCGDLIDLICTWEQIQSGKIQISSLNGATTYSNQAIKRQNMNSNSKKAHQQNLNETPSSFQVNKKSLNDHHNLDQISQSAKSKNSEDAFRTPSPIQTSFNSQGSKHSSSVRTNKLQISDFQADLNSDQDFGLSKKAQNVNPQFYDKETQTNMEDLDQLRQSVSTDNTLKEKRQMNSPQQTGRPVIVGSSQPKLVGLKRTILDRSESAQQNCDAKSDGNLKMVKNLLKSDTESLLSDIKAEFMSNSLNSRSYLQQELQIDELPEDKIPKIFCQNKRRAQMLLHNSAQLSKSLPQASMQNSSTELPDRRLFELVEIKQSKPQTPTFKNVNQFNSALSMVVMRDKQSAQTGKSQANSGNSNNQ
eukprot:403340129